MSAEAPPKGVVPPSDPGGRSGFLSDVIVELGFATPDAVEEAVREARSGSTVAQVLVEKGSISEEQLARATAERYGLAYIDLGDFEVDRDAAALIRPSAAKRYRAVPVGFMSGGLLVAMTDPADSLAVNDIAVMTKLEVQPAATTRSGLDALLAAAGGSRGDGGARWVREARAVGRGLLAGGDGGRRRDTPGRARSRAGGLGRRGPDAERARRASPQARGRGDRAGQGARRPGGIPGRAEGRPRGCDRHDGSAGPADRRAGEPARGVQPRERRGGGAEREGHGRRGRAGRRARGRRRPRGRDAGGAFR